MIPYLPPHLPGELLYSRLARSFHGDIDSTGPEQAARIVSSASRHLGLLLPAYGDQILKNVPAVSSLTKEGMFAATLMPAIKPFLEPTELEKLCERCMLGAVRINIRPFGGSRAIPFRLRFCPECARADVAANRPPHWHTAHQHPCSLTCAVHGKLLVETNTTDRSPSKIFVPGDWIDPNHPGYGPATSIEVQIAKDLVWLLERQGGPTPGRKQLDRQLLQLLYSKVRYRGFAGSVKTKLVIEDLQELLGQDVLLRLNSQLDPFDPWNWVRSTVYSSHPQPFLRYTLLAHLLGLSLQQLLESVPPQPKPRLLKKPDGTPEIVAKAKAKISAAMQLHPNATRTELQRRCRPQILIVSAHAKDWCREFLPARKHQERRPRSDWNEKDELRRDEVIAAYIHLENRCKLDPNAKRISVSRLFCAAGLTGFRRRSITALMPKTNQAAADLADSDGAFVKRRAEAGALQFFRENRVIDFKRFKARLEVRELCDADESCDQAAYSAWLRYQENIQGPTLFSMLDEALEMAA